MGVLLTSIFETLCDIKKATLLGVKEVLNVDEAVMFTGYSKQQLYKLAQHRLIPHYRSSGGKLIFFNKEELNKWMMSVKVSTIEELDKEATKRIS